MKRLVLIQNIPLPFALFCSGSAEWKASPRAAIPLAETAGCFHRDRIGNEGCCRNRLERHHDIMVVQTHPGSASVEGIEYKALPGNLPVAVPGTESHAYALALSLGTFRNMHLKQICHHLNAEGPRRIQHELSAQVLLKPAELIKLASQGRNGQDERTIRRTSARQTGEHSALKGAGFGMYVFIEAYDPAFGVYRFGMHQFLQCTDILLQRLLQWTGKGCASQAIERFPGKFFPEGTLEFRNTMIHISSDGIQYGPGMFNDIAGRLDILISTIGTCQDIVQGRSPDNDLCFGERAFYIADNILHRRHGRGHHR